ncbi:MAG: sodium:calcium antiporter [Thermoleophilia bacterium]|nr:sodium:calcium antiporter [Thermoleophilia bacterium]
MGDVLLLLASLVVILAGCELFVNAIEWLGERLHLDDGATGSILAAVGTAMPETLIPIIAIVFSGEEDAEEVGIGAIVGAPFLLATLAFAVVATATLVFAARGRRTRVITADRRVMGRDLTFFLGAFAVAILLGVVDAPGWAKTTVAFGLLATYGVYVWRTLQGDAAHGEEIKPLYLHRRAVRPATAAIVVQSLIGLGLIVAGAELFVQGVTGVADALAVPTLALSLLIAPLATELPEKFNSVFWIRDRKDTLALGNITGAMVFQSTIPVCVGLALTPWELDRFAVVSGVLALVSGAIVWAGLRLRRAVTWPVLALGLPFYLAFVIYVIAAV